MGNLFSSSKKDKEPLAKVKITVENTDYNDFVCEFANEKIALNWVCNMLDKLLVACGKLIPCVCVDVNDLYIRNKKVIFTRKKNDKFSDCFKNKCKSTFDTLLNENENQTYIPSSVYNNIKDKKYTLDDFIKKKEVLFSNMGISFTGINSFQKAANSCFTAISSRQKAGRIVSPKPDYIQNKLKYLRLNELQ